MLANDYPITARPPRTRQAVKGKCKECVHKLCQGLRCRRTPWWPTGPQPTPTQDPSTQGRESRRPTFRGRALRAPWRLSRGLPSTHSVLIKVAQKGATSAYCPTAQRAGPPPAGDQSLFSAELSSWAQGLAPTLSSPPWLFPLSLTSRSQCTAAVTMRWHCLSKKK